MFFRDFSEYKTYLNSLTTRDLARLADHEGIDIPPGLDRVFIIRELLDNEIENRNPAEPLAEKPHQATVELPRRYNITYLEVLPRDPQWVYAFWEIKAQDREHYERDPRFDGYALKALERRQPQNSQESPFIELFSVPVGPEDNSWYLGFPKDGVFRIALWVEGFNVYLVSSRVFEFPRFLNSPGNDEYLASPLIRLSGAADLEILRDAEKAPRSRV